MAQDKLNTVFCRQLLSLVHADVRKIAGIQRPMKAAWVYATFGIWEFHGPNNYYWHGRAYNAYEARAKGWQGYLDKHYPDSEAALAEARK
ncbi:unnamed protein product [marine sediment metagenome]|uniref:Uncharacterized protein n=1 Tax=marine sediment metagenome TaxID=412755 RepID=X1C3M8_9ZZZZ